MQTVEDIRLEAIRLDADRFEKAHPGPVLLLWQQVDGDLQFASIGELEAQPREGNTMVHVPRVSMTERLSGDLRPGRTPLARERWFPATVNDGEIPLRVGRERGCDIRLNDFTVSALHAWLWGVPGTLRAFIEDADSRNGTVHNGVRLVPGVRSELHSGDELVFGQFALLFLCPADFHRYLTGKR